MKHEQTDNDICLLQALQQFKIQKQSSLLKAVEDLIHSTPYLDYFEVFDTFTLMDEALVKEVRSICDAPGLSDRELLSVLEAYSEYADVLVDMHSTVDQIIQQEHRLRDKHSLPNH
jgi:hypothetical protein